MFSFCVCLSQNWEAFVLIKDLLGADFEGFAARKSDVLIKLNGEHVKCLMALNNVGNVQQAYQRLLVC